MTRHRRSKHSITVSSGVRPDPRWLRLLDKIVTGVALGTALFALVTWDLYWLWKAIR